MNSGVFFTMLAVLVIGDALWLGVIMRQFYQLHLGHILSGSVQWVPAVLFYCMYTVGVFYFAIQPHVMGGMGKVMFMSALLGAFAYATYDLTNHATVKDWPLIVTVLDICWGAFLSSLMGAVGYYVLTLYK